MISTRPYLVRAFYEWIVDNGLTPYIVVNASMNGVKVPEQYIDDNGQIVLNISMDAVNDLELENDLVTFEARFNGVVHFVRIPIRAVLAIYAKQNGKGMVFSEEEFDDLPVDDFADDGSDEDADTEADADDKKSGSSAGKRKKGGGKPNLTIVK